MGKMVLMFTAFLSFDVVEPKGRGVNKNIKLEKEVRKHKDLLRKGEKFKPTVTILEDENRPVGEWSASFARELGIIIRRDAPVAVRSWKYIPSETKQQLLQQAAVGFNTYIYIGYFTVHVLLIIQSVVGCI